MRRGGSPVLGSGRRRDLIRKSETNHRIAGHGAHASAFAVVRLIATAILLAVVTIAALSFTTGSANAEDRALKLYNVHNKERAVIYFKRHGKFDRAGLAKINKFLRDWRRNEPTKIDPQLLDLVWEAYRRTGSNEYIHVISSYRSPTTNNALRSRSKGVAKNSQHTQGKAMDFYIPGVALADLRAIGLRLQVGGVGYYPGSGSPFVHMDTGSVRHWPRMSRQQLVKVFPNGKTLHVPSDGNPLPGYAVALAAHKLRGKSGSIGIASFDDGPKNSRNKRAVGEPVVIASVAGDSNEDEFEATASGDYSAADATPPLPRPSPFPVHGYAPTVIAAAEPVPQSLQPEFNSRLTIASLAAGEFAQRREPRPFEFESTNHWNQPAVPAALARAMAERDISRPASFPIQPTAVVATVDVSRPLRAEAITTAVLNRPDGKIRDITPVFAYAAPMDVTSAPQAPAPVRQTDMNAVSAPIPVANPVLITAVVEQPVATGSIAPREPRFPAEDLTLTALDTLGLRQWIGNESTRQRQYALMTMPDFSQIPTLLSKPRLAYRAGFGDLAYQGLRTDRFSGPLVRLPLMIDLSSRAHLAFR
jgi:uncharacterized protein YcbK (DUF882 family)